MRSPLQTIIHETPSQGGWDVAWKKGTTGWDLGGATKVLIDELKKERQRLTKISPTKMDGWKALIPGCGSGYDLFTLGNHHDLLFDYCNAQDSASSELKTGTVVGLDISPISVQRTQAMLDQSQKDQSHPGKNTNIKLICDDFFKATFETGEFNFIFDYTFFCAIPPSFRNDWGKRMGDIVAPNGTLLTLAFPIVLPDTDMLEKKQNETLMGPPYAVTIEEYKRVLEPNGFQMMYEPVESEFTEASRKGKEVPIWWKKTADN